MDFKPIPLKGLSLFLGTEVPICVEVRFSDIASPFLMVDKLVGKRGHLIAAYQSSFSFNFWSSNGAMVVMHDDGGKMVQKEEGITKSSRKWVITESHLN